MPRGRKRWNPDRALPDFSKTPTFVLIALRAERISRSAFCLWSVIRCFAWRDTVKGQFSPPPVDLKDEELQAWLRGLTRRYIYKLIDELEQAGLLKVTHEGGRRWLQLLAPSSSGDSRELYFTGQKRPDEDDEDEPLSGGEILPPPHPHSPSTGGAGGERKGEREFTANGVPGKSGSRGAALPSGSPPADSALPEGAEAIARVLREYGIFPGPAADIARKMHAEGVTPDKALDIIRGVLADTGSIGMAVYRLRQGIWDTAAQERALEKARRHRYGAVGREDRQFGKRLPEVPSGPPDADPEGSIRTVVGEMGTAEQVWRAALGLLELEMTRATFNTHLSPARLVAYDDGVFTVAVPSEYSRQWLERRLATVVLRALRQLTGRKEISVRFVTEAEWAAGPIAGEKA